ncbi:MAG: hypothetical protein [Olavius algarvensis Gamma 1 endosymbiont]|nr:MAG: hypothetical protein [Olavius algarvensis Gamma 1 endosymbiont]
MSSYLTLRHSRSMKTLELFLSITYMIYKDIIRLDRPD